MNSNTTPSPRPLPQAGGEGKGEGERPDVKRRTAFVSNTFFEAKEITHG
jgi:hypothetical protein